MPKIADKPIKEKERFFVNLFVKASGDESQIAAFEKRAHLKKGSGTKILARQEVRKEIALRLAPVQEEQVRQQTIGDAVLAAKEAMQQELAAAVAVIKTLKLDPEILEGRLMQGVIGIDMGRFPDVLLEYIKAGYVLNGSLQSGNTKRLTPTEETKENPAATVYRAIFSSPTETPTQAPNLLEIAEDPPPAGAAPLYPDIKPPAPLKLTADPLPSAGESIEEVKPNPINSDIITVQIG